MQFGGVEHTTPPLPEEAASQPVPPYEAVHGLFPVQVTILAPESEMSIAVFELIMMTKLAVEEM